ncbi:MAG: cyclodeaminase/cyclohydrolase family protein [Lachnospiraceae bacterium]|jgi:formiminotetrahydrofolate cyclodeaminase|nr:cyclodeaminase/cyclohydrolase family protein [Lachnospiraceae bacterium]
MKYTELTCSDFLCALASREPVPGGGGASALVGAVGIALGNMVGSLTLGKKKYADVQADIIALDERAAKLREELLALVQRDAEAFEPLSRAYGLPSGTDDEKAHKAAVMEAALQTACGAPLEIMRLCCEAIDLVEAYAAKGSALAVSDAGCGALCLGAALQAAGLNVSINTKSMADRAYAGRIDAEAGAMLDAYVPKADRIYRRVSARFEA